MKKIVVFLQDLNVSAFNLTPSQAEDLRHLFSDSQVIFCRDRKSFMDLLPQMNTAIVWTFERDWIASAVNLETVITPAAGKDYLNWPAQSPVKVTYGSFHGSIISETVLGMMLAHCRGLGTGIRIHKTHPWPRGYLSGRIRRFEGSRITIIGFGSIGNEIGRKASLLGAHITGVKRKTATTPSWFKKEDRILTSESDWRKVLPETDHLVLCLPFDESTKQSIDLSIFASLPQHAAIYNVGRGHCINEKDLISALDEGLIEAAYLDVFNQEPLPYSSGLRDIDNCFIFPHISAIAPDYLDLFIHELKEKLS